MIGTSVTVHYPIAGAKDRFGNTTFAYGSVCSACGSVETVDNVLIAPATTADMEAARPEGVTVAYTLHFPKTYNGTLEGCMITLPAPWSGDYTVVGDPRPYMDANTPTDWHLQVQVERAHG